MKLTPTQIEKIRSLCLERAKARGYIFYSEIANALGIALVGHNELGEALDVINRDEYAKDIYAPLLSAVVVGKVDMAFIGSQGKGNSRGKMPGEGFFKLAKQLGKQKPTQSNDDFFKEELLRVYEYYK